MIAAMGELTIHGMMMLTARVLLALVFLVMGWRQVAQWARVAADMEMRGMRSTSFFLAGAVAIEFVGGTALAVGYAADWAAIVLALYTVIATLIFYRRLGEREDLLHTLKNLAIVGGLLMVAAVGPGPLSFDH
jgi:putative oxidoreductase